MFIIWNNQQFSSLLLEIRNLYGILSVLKEIFDLLSNLNSVSFEKHRFFVIEG